MLCLPDEMPFYRSEAASALDICSLDPTEIIGRISMAYRVTLEPDELSVPLSSLVRLIETRRRSTTMSGDRLETLTPCAATSVPPVAQLVTVHARSFIRRGAASPVLQAQTPQPSTVRGF